MKKEMLKDFTEKISAHVPEILTACNGYIVAKARYNAVTELANDCKKQVLSDHEFFIADEFKNRRGLTENRITDPARDYMMDDAVFKIYSKYCYQLYVNAGIDDPRGVDYIPEAVPREELHKAEENLIDTFLKITPDNMTADFDKMRNHWKYRQKLIDIALDMLKLESVKEA